MARCRPAWAWARPCPTGIANVLVPRSCTSSCENCGRDVPASLFLALPVGSHNKPNGAEVQPGRATYSASWTGTHRRGGKNRCNLVEMRSASAFDWTLERGSAELARAKYFSTCSAPRHWLGHTSAASTERTARCRLGRARTRTAVPVPSGI